MSRFPINVAKSLAVEAPKNSTIGIKMPNNSLICVWTDARRREFPPRSKKFSLSETDSVFNTSFQMATSLFSMVFVVTLFLNALFPLRFLGAPCDRFSELMYEETSRVACNGLES